MAVDEPPNRGYGDELEGSGEVTIRELGLGAPANRRPSAARRPPSPAPFCDRRDYLRPWETRLTPNPR
ncbi:hypothetical protein [Natronosalvus halobius]|uniref:hypothetical protein n=1 Tax=Natronosalvus halobius TaxID=2953746 RepID=UPI00209F4F7B|nr:hypothetical protein [Natronosalvus halobius]USZ73108.1 hypothetical protein NGM15_07345 [Natronosalvus halobius]